MDRAGDAAADAAAQVRVTGPSRVLLAVATAALVAVTSGATALVVLTGTGGVRPPAAQVAPRPPVAAPAASPPIVIVEPGALGTPPRSSGRTPARRVDGAARAGAGTRAGALPLGQPLGELSPLLPAVGLPAPVLEPVLEPVPVPVVPVVDPVEPVVEPVEEPVFGPRVPPRTGGEDVGKDKGQGSGKGKDRGRKAEVPPPGAAEPALPASPAPAAPRAVPARPASPAAASAGRAAGQAAAEARPAAGQGKLRTTRDEPRGSETRSTGTPPSRAKGAARRDSPDRGRPPARRGQRG